MVHVAAAAAMWLAARVDNCPGGQLEDKFPGEKAWKKVEAFGTPPRTTGRRLDYREVPFEIYKQARILDIPESMAADPPEVSGDEMKSEARLVHP